jgi:hypothetical protein
VEAAEDLTPWPPCEGRPAECAARVRLDETLGGTARRPEERGMLVELRLRGRGRRGCRRRPAPQGRVETSPVLPN